jgi:excisionase family DNA binding protein
MAGRKVYCEAVEGVVYSDRCPLKLSKMISDNKTCGNCLILQLEKNERELKQALGISQNRSKVKSARTKSSSDIKDTSDTKDTSDIKGVRRGRRRIKGSPREKPNPIRDEDTVQTYRSQDLIELLGKSERTIRKWAQKGEIPARKVGREWRFPKEEFDRWLSEKGQRTDIVMTKLVAIQGEDVRPLDESVEGIAGESLNKEDSESISN